MENVTHRLNEFMKLKNHTTYSFEIANGLTKNALWNAMNKGKSFGVKTLEKIGKNFPELDMNWLLTGRGSMLFGEAAEVPGHISLNSGCEEWQYKYYQLLEKYNACLEAKAEMLVRGEGG